MQYSHLNFYRPRITRQYLYCRNESDPDILRYNHCVDMIRFKGKFWALWNANAAPAEGVNGQYNYLSCSDDFIHWSAPVRLFDNPEHSENPIHDDHQWQPSLINVRDEYLLCAWCVVGTAVPRLFVSRSEDGWHWTNHEVQNAPDALYGIANGFPTNHGYITSSGRLIFPCSIPYRFPDGQPGYTCYGCKYSGLLMSDDGGDTWFWSEPIRCADFTAYGENTDVEGEAFASTWEPMVYGLSGGRLGLLVRNSQGQDRFELKESAHRMLFYSTSDDDGSTWTPSLPVEVETVCSRNFTLGSDLVKDGYIMLHNDQQVCVPTHIAGDRYHLGVFLTATEDPNTFLPGPVLFPQGIAYYPNGFVDKDTLYFGASAPSGILCGTLTPLPDFSRPFLMLREGRTLPEYLGDGVYNICSSACTIPLVLNRPLTEAQILALRFCVTVHAYDEQDYPLLTVGGVSRNGFILCAHCDADGEFVMACTTDGGRFRICPLHRGETLDIRVELTATFASIRINDSDAFTLPGWMIRKFAFGGLYLPQAWPDVARNYAQVLLDVNSITLMDKI